MCHHVSGGRGKRMAEKKRGASGGDARREKLSPERRSEIAKAAASKRWGKNGSSDPKGITGITILNGEYGTESTVTVDVESIPEPFGESPVDAGPKHCPACIMGQNLLKGEGTHLLATVEHPVEVNHTPTPVAQAQPRKGRAKPMPKAFKGASSYAEKRLAEALKERAEYMGRVAALNAEIPSLVQVIRALGTSTIPPEAMQSYPIPTPNYQSIVPQGYPTEQIPSQANNIDPALFSANSDPLPGLVPAARNAPIITQTSAGGALDLDYIPRDEEAPGLPRMGNGWM
jgi:hypothetical protein